jgi:3-oxosteroid 1-dehydrogenase
MAGQDETFDFVIVGSGGGSMCAALVMRRMGKSVVILEKTEFVGGSTAMSGGVLWIPNNHLNRAAGVRDSAERSLEYLDTLTSSPDPGRGGTPARRRAFVEQGPKMLEFLEEMGIKLERAPGYSDYYDDSPGGLSEGRAVIAGLFDVNRLGPEWLAKFRLTGLTLPMKIQEVCRIGLAKRTWEGRWAALKLAARMAKGRITGQRVVGTGAALQARMLEASVKAGVDIRVSAPVTRLLVEDGRVVGVTVAQDSEEQRIYARLGVLLNAGGFSRNQAMRDNYQPGIPTNWTNANPGDTGEMIEEALRIGASVDLMDESWWITTSRPPGVGNLLPMHLQDIAKPHAMLVDQAGQRFCNESASYMEIGRRQREHTRQGVNAIPAWLIMDSRHRDSYFMGAVPPGPPPKSWVETGYMKVADTIEDLARALKLDPAALKATQERFNGFAERGVDVDFHRGRRKYDIWFGDASHRPSATLGAISKPPFYALGVYPGDVGTAGGVVADEYARALTADDSVIPGLYVTGNTSAPVTGRYYVGPGTSIGASFTFGYIAARHAASAN